LSIQGIIIPLAQTYIVYRIFNYLIPSYKGTVAINPIFSFLLNFLFVDYLFFLTHRLFHGNSLWGFHVLHHSSTTMDVIVSSRNSVWTSFVFPYLWFNALFLFLLSDRTAFLAAMSLSAVMDLWRHSYLCPNSNSKFYKLISTIFITPIDHAWHHSRSKSRVNFGANMNLWDKLHGTFYKGESFPDDLGFKLKGSLFTKLFRPIKLGKDN
jgi:sterol desaturase/sphingolipid hydroxylase (fatty acid hydroxylase superfamily)